MYPISPHSELKEELESELLRGIPLHVALRSRYWASPEGGRFDESKSYSLSEPCERFSYFLSHDWKTSRYHKKMSLLIVFNARCAFCASLATSLLVGGIEVAAGIPENLWAPVFGHVVYFLVLLFWQQLRSALCRGGLVFFDKLCIPQHDVALKEKCILGLAAFLHRSEKLLVLWSPRYFSRLWCAYEIATFMKEQDRSRTIEVMPVQMSAILFLFSGAWHVLTWGYYVVDDAADGLPVLQQTIIVGPLFALICAAVAPLAYNMGIGMMKDVEDLPQQLRNFDIREVSCSCCSFPDHVHPETGCVSPCTFGRWASTLPTGRRVSRGSRNAPANPSSPWRWCLS
mmetsp:Transcript_32140/g.74038  ORF Transcript_32140/g.74038 Transcript_32140/m.74038 type:complete len:343 (+) Transcript_32140:39-1067(+)